MGENWVNGVLDLNNASDQMVKGDEDMTCMVIYGKLIADNQLVGGFNIHKGSLDNLMSTFAMLFASSPDIAGSALGALYTVMADENTDPKLSGQLKDLIEELLKIER